ncbi:MAG: hypothetical protein M5U32_18275 [Myxococcota bacterium]|nr:hypothetical protein [Myxococcota bacterium]
MPKDMRVSFQRFKAELSAALGGVALDDSNLGRALFQEILERHGEAILEAARDHAWDYDRPASSDAEAMAAFDDALQEVIGAALGT